MLAALICDETFAVQKANAFVNVATATPGVEQIVSVGGDFHITTKDVSDLFTAQITVTSVYPWILDAPAGGSISLHVGTTIKYKVHHATLLEMKAVEGEITLFKVDVSIADINEENEMVEGAFCIFAQNPYSVDAPDFPRQLTRVRIRCLPSTRPLGENIVLSFPQHHLLEKESGRYAYAMRSYPIAGLNSREFFLLGREVSLTLRDRAITATHSINHCADEAKYTVIKLISTTKSQTPPDRSRSILGVCEEVYLTMLPDSIMDVAWSCFPPLSGEITPQRDNTAVLLAPELAGAITAKAQVGNATCEKVFTVIAPQDVAMTKTREDQYEAGTVAAGMFMSIKILPATVSFYNIVIRESDCEATDATGYFYGRYIHHDANETWIDVAENNEVDGEDHAEFLLRSPPDAILNSHVRWPIPYMYWRNTDQILNGQRFKIVDQSTDITTTWRTTIQKAGASVSRERNAGPQRN